MKRLSYFLEHGLDRAVINKMKSDNQMDFVKLKEFLIDLVGKLVPEISSSGIEISNYFRDMIFSLRENQFRSQDMVYWTNSYLETRKMKDYINERQNHGNFFILN